MRLEEEIENKLKKYLNFKNGKYIELGAYNGLTFSNTKWLENSLGWKGILIEPSLNRYKECIKNRPNNHVFNCACVSLEYKENVIKGDFIGTPTCSVGGWRKGSNTNNIVKARTLSSIISECNYKDIDFLSLDVEGYELEVLKGIDFKNHSIKYILIEILTQFKATIFKFLTDNNYTFIENISNFDKETHPNWDGTHDDYLFILNK